MSLDSLQSALLACTILTFLYIAKKATRRYATLENPIESDSSDSEVSLYCQPPETSSRVPSQVSLYTISEVSSDIRFTGASLEDVRGIQHLRPTDKPSFKNVVPSTTRPPQRSSLTYYSAPTTYPSQTMVGGSASLSYPSQNVPTPCHGRQELQLQLQQQPYTLRTIFSQKRLNANFVNDCDFGNIGRESYGNNMIPCEASSTASSPQCMPQSIAERTAQCPQQHSPQRAAQCPQQYSPQRTAQYPQQHSPQRTAQCPQQHSPQRTAQCLQQHSPQRTAQCPQQHSPERTAQCLQQHSPQRTAQYPQQHSPQRTAQCLQQHSPQRTAQCPQQHSPERTAQCPQQHSPQRTAQYPQQHSPERTTQCPQQHSSHRSPQRTPQHSPQRTPQHSPQRTSQCPQEQKQQHTQKHTPQCPQQRTQQHTQYTTQQTNKTRGDYICPNQLKARPSAQCLTSNVSRNASSEPSKPSTSKSIQRANLSGRKHAMHSSCPPQLNPSKLALERASPRPALSRQCFPSMSQTENQGYTGQSYPRNTRPLVDEETSQLVDLFDTYFYDLFQRIQITINMLNGIQNYFYYVRQHMQQFKK